MSGGTFNYLQRRSEWQEAIKRIEAITEENNNQLRLDVIEEFKKGLKVIKEAKVYLERIDYLLSDDDGEDCFLKRLKTDLDTLL
jgi:exonuclease VII small subunit